MGGVNTAICNSTEQDEQENSLTSSRAKKKLSVVIDSLQECLQRLQTDPSKLLTRFLIMRWKVAKLPSKEHPLELLETAHAIADHSLLQISRRKCGEAYFKRFKTLPKRK